MNTEELLYPKFVETMGETKLYSLYEQHKNDPIGTELVHDVAAPGIGRITYTITRINDEGIYAKVTSDTTRILEPWECM